MGISYKELEPALVIWIDQILEDNEVVRKIKIDGKKNDKNVSSRTTIVRAFLSGINQVKGAVQIKEGENEIVAIPTLIKKLYIKGYLVTIDAIGTQIKITNLIVPKGADYLVPVKKNQKLLYDDLKLFLETEIADGNNNCSIAETHDEGHGRIENRKSYAFTEVDWLIKRNPKWSHIKSFCLLRSMRQEKGKDSVITDSIYISSRVLKADEFILEIKRSLGY